MMDQDTHEVVHILSVMIKHIEDAIKDLKKIANDRVMKETKDG